MMRACLKVEEGVCLAFEARKRSEEEDEHARIESEEEAHLFEHRKRRRITHGYRLKKRHVSLKKLG